ncbi:putative porin [Ravibacter arvi]
MNWPTIRKYSYCILLLVGLIVFGTPLVAQRLPGRMQLPTGGGGGGGGAPVIDDSTKNIYGPKTTSYFFEEDILDNRDSTRYHVDTSLNNFHRWTFVDRDWNRLVDLGNLGTASRPMFFTPRMSVGRQLGFRAFDAYAFKPGDVQYYDTKSPYTDMYYVQGGLNREILRFGFTQNVNPQVNFGIRIQRLSAQRQYGSYQPRGKAASLARDWSVLLHGSYFSKNKKYALLAHIRTMNHTQMEQGGVILEDSVNYVIGRDDYTGPARLSPAAKSWFRRNTLRVYQQYRLVSGFQVFNQLELENSANRYTDNQPADGLANGVYNLISDREIPPDQTINHTILDNKFGIKGALSGYNYRAYFQVRAQKMQGERHIPDSNSEKYSMSRFEPILGLWMQYRMKDTTWRITSQIEHVLARDLLLKGQLDIPWAKLGFQTALTSPDLLMGMYKNSYLYWNNPDNSFRLAKTVSFTGALPVRLKRFSVTPDFQWHQLVNYLYYDENALPAQHDGSFSLMRIGAETELELKRWRFRTFTYYNEGFDNRIFRVPRLFLSGEVSFAFTYAKALDIQLGVSGYYTTKYYADAYMPMTQQFHVQNKLQVGNYPVADVFANLRIKRVLLLLKYSHVNHRWGSNGEGYFVTPGYMGLKPAFSFGVRWPLFD